MQCYDEQDHWEVVVEDQAVLVHQEEDLHQGRCLLAASRTSQRCQDDGAATPNIYQQMKQGQQFH
jgi:hypothetical protein